MPYLPPLLAQSAASEETTGALNKAMEFFRDFFSSGAIGIFLEGGIFMWPILILLIVLIQGYDAQKGVASLLSGECGCFGSAGPPPVYMLLIDGLLLIGVLVFRPARCGAGARIAPLAAGLSILIG